jgi:hypothetical protein
MISLLEMSYLETIQKNLEPKTNYIKFQSGDKKTLIFGHDEEHVMQVDDERFGKRVRFIVTDVTDAMRPIENRIWDTSPRWARIIISYILKNRECLEVERQGTGTGTNYMITPALEH